MAPSVVRDRIVGFTLIELLITLTLLGLVSALAIPNVASWLAAREFATAVSALKAEITQLPLSAAVGGEAITVDNGYVWQQTQLQSLARVKSPITVYPNGYCSGGRIVLEHNGRSRDFTVLAPFCAVTSDGD